MTTKKHPQVDLGRVEGPVNITPSMRFIPGDRLGDAEFVGYFRDDSSTWHENRAKGYGGSDVAAITGCSKWTQPFDLWAERTGQVERQDDGKNSEAKMWGSYHEPTIRNHFATQNPGLIVVSAPKGYGMSWRNVNRPWHLASPDALTYAKATGEWGILEIKTARYDDDWKDPDTRRWVIPLYYETQSGWYLDCFGWDLAIFAVLFTGSSYREFPAPVDPFAQDVNRHEVETFIGLVESKTPPALRGADTEVYTQRRRHPDIDPKTEADVGPTGAAWIAAKRAKEEAEAAYNIAAAELLEHLGTANYGLDENGKKVVRRQAKAGSPAWLVAVK